MSKRALGFMNKGVVIPPILYNTYIGGVSASLSTASLLATKLGISVGRIENFTIVGTDIQCRITGSYGFSAFSFLADNSITYYTDIDNLVHNIDTEAFKDVTLLKELNFKGVITLTGNAIARTSSVNKVSLENCTSITGTAFSSSGNVKIIYIPRCTSLGTTVGNNNVFDEVGNNWSSTTLYVPISLQTVNAGAPDGDLTFFISKGGTVKYVSNFIVPSAPAIASATGYITYVNLSVSTSSTNTVDYYELYNNGVFVKNIPATGFIDDLAQLTSFNFSVIAVDVMYNKSPMSNTVATATTTTSLMPLINMLRYFKMSEPSGTTAVDSFGANNGTYVSMTLLQPAKVGFGVKGSGTTSYINLNSSSITGGKTAFSVSLWFKIASLANANALYGSWVGAQNSTLIRVSGGQLQFFLQTLTGQSGGSFIAFSDTTNWHHLVCTYDGTTMRMYLDGTATATTMARTGTVNIGTATERIGDAQGAGSPNSFDEAAIYSRALTAGEVTTIYNSGNGITL